jgi:hypothetical protein
MTQKDRITAERLRELLHYDPEAGIVVWRVSEKGRKRRGKPAGFVSKGYFWIGVDRRRYPAAPLAWLYMTGEWPLDDVDHRDLNGRNNKWSNLRRATRSQNCGNTPPHCDSTTGIKGVFLDKRNGRWRAQGCIGGQQKHLGSFATCDEAAEMYRKWALQAFGEFARAA